MRDTGDIILLASFYWDCVQVRILGNTTHVQGPREATVPERQTTTVASRLFAKPWKGVPTRSIVV